MKRDDLQGYGTVVILLTHHLSIIVDMDVRILGRTLTVAGGDHHYEGHVGAAASVSRQHLRVPYNVDVLPVLFPHVQEIP